MSVTPDARVAELVLTHPTLHGHGATIGELRALFLDDHVHMALLVDGPRLVAAVERDDLRAGLPDRLPARLVGALHGRVLSPGTSAAHALAAMRKAGRRRFAVIDDDGSLVGLLCLKARGHGFCSDADVVSRKLSRVA